MDLLEELLPNMRRVQSAERDLRELGLLWAMIEASSAIGCPLEAQSILPTLSETRDRFTDLQQRLVRQLGREGVAELAGELGSAAQCSIDILVRNLFERTADVGFLATDDVLCQFMTGNATARHALHADLRRRLRAYTEKYTVYDDIVVLAADGRVLLRLDESRPLASEESLVREPLLAQALARPGYVEQFDRSALAADDGPALLYAHRLECPAAGVLGVLVLRFRLADELQRIFADLTRGQRQLALMMLDPDHRVVASNDTVQVPLGTKLDVPAGGDGTRLALLTLAGAEYLAVRSDTRGYQGYMGPGWYALAMLPLATAFRSRMDDRGLPEGVALDNDELRRVQAEVDAINRNLRRVVWNGRLLAHARGLARSDLRGPQLQLKAVLQQISHTGGRMRDRAGAAIHDLYRSSLARSRQHAGALARLAADIMDRNLYERANDCRWWALSPVLRGVLSSASNDAAGPRQMQSVLQTINALYTVYTRLVVFDAQGTIRAVSNDDSTQTLVGQSVPAVWLQATMALTDGQRYAVSSFEATTASGGVPTYVYLAAVRDRVDASAGAAPVGGIAIVFNAEREFRAMLLDVLDGRTGMAAFVDAAGHVIACSDDSIRVGELLPFEAEPGVAKHAGAYHAVAVVAATGYREFKCQDGYDNGVRAVVALRLGALERRKRALYDTELRPPLTSQGAAAGTAATSLQQTQRELALFQVGSARYAVSAEAVLEALPDRGMVRLGSSTGPMVGLLDVGPAHGGRVLPVLCARRIFGVAHAERETDGIVLVLADPESPGQPACGLRVDDLNSVLDVEPALIQPASAGLRSRCDWLQALIRLQTVEPQPVDVIVQLIDTAAVVALSPVQRSTAGVAAGV